MQTQPTYLTFSLPLINILLFYAFFRFGIHNRISLCVCRIFIYKRNNHVIEQNQTGTRLLIGYMGKLLFRKPQLICKYRLILCILIQQINKIGVTKNTLDFLRL